MKEYGGYLEMETFHGDEFHDSAYALNCGRGCVEYLIRARNIQKLYLPYFLCASVSGVCERLHVEVSYYRINTQFQPQFSSVLREGEWLYIVNYYGQLSNDMILDFKGRYQNIIIDNVQAFFQLPVAGVDTLYSCRKYFGVTDGAYLYTDAKFPDTLERDVSFERALFLFGRYEKDASSFYSEYVANNKRFASESVKEMSLLTHNLLRGIDYDAAQEIRTQNFAVLQERFAKKNQLQLKTPQGGFMYPLYLENGKEVRKKLIQQKIYIPTLWSDVFDVCSPDDLEYRLAENILPLPIDQRYTLDDMMYIADVIEKSE